PHATTKPKALQSNFWIISIAKTDAIAPSNTNWDTLVPALTNVRVSITMTNLINPPVPYSRRQVSLHVAGSATSIPVSSASIRTTGQLKSGSAFRAVYRFDIPTAASDLLVRFDDPGRAAPVWIDLGSGPFPVGVSSAYNLRLHHYIPHQHGAGR